MVFEHSGGRDFDLQARVAHSQMYTLTTLTGVGSLLSLWLWSLNIVDDLTPNGSEVTCEVDVTTYVTLGACYNLTSTV